MSTSHQSAILDQFTRQAVPFSTAPGIRDDPSHVRAPTLAELAALFADVGLPEPVVTRYRLASDLDGLLSRPFPDPGDAEKVRALFRDSLADDGLGVGARERAGEIHFAYPIAILAARRGP